MQATLKMTRRLRDTAEMQLQPLQEHPKYRAAAEELAALEQRLAAAEQRERVAMARRRGQQPTRSILDRARDLVAGGSVVASTPASELEAAGEEQQILRRAINEQREKLAAIAGEVSHEVCARFAPAAKEALLAALEAVTQLHVALESGRVIRSRLIASGYTLDVDAIPVHMFPPGAALGDPDRVGMTPAAIFKQWLRDKGVI
jgi:hypothetical protein